MLLADAARNKAQIAHRLGWIPTATWEDVWHGHAPLAEAVVESVADRLAVLPRAEPRGRGQDAAVGRVAHRRRPEVPGPAI